jgi:hypothetical protein
MEEGTYDIPVHPPPESEPPTSPLTTSQYNPSDIEDVNVALHGESILLITTNPAEP